MTDDTYIIPDSSNRDYWRQTYPDLADVFGDETQLRRDALGIVANASNGQVKKIVAAHKKWRAKAKRKKTRGSK